MERTIGTMFGGRRRGGITLREALLRLILITLLPLALASGVIAWQLWTAQQTAAEDGLRDTAMALSLAVDREVMGVRGQLEAVAGSRLIDDRNWGELHRFLNTIAGARYGAVIAIVDGTGQLQVQTNFEYGSPLPNLWQIESKHEKTEWNGRRLPLSSQGLTRKVFATGAPAVSGLYVSIVGRHPVVGLSVPVIRGEQVRYAIVYSFPPESLERFLGPEDHTALRLALTDRDGVVIAASAASSDVIGNRAAPDIAREPADRKWSIVQRVASDGVPVLSAFAASEVTGWTVRVSQPLREALAPAYQALTAWLGLFAAVLVAAVIGAAILSKRLASPLVQLADSAGGRPASTPPTGVREIDVLSERLARAAASEAARRTEIERRVAAEERERAAAESERIVRQHLEELEDADRRKDHFLAMLGHELRNPLSPILNSAQLMRHGGPDGEAVQRSAGVIERQVQHLARLIDDLLDVARITEGKIVLKRQRVELLPLLSQALESTRGMIEARGQHLTLRTPDEPVFLDADPARIVQVVTNLLNNAAKYTPDGGHIDVAAECDGGELCLRVRDDGIGIPHELMPKLFVPFAQGPDSGQRSQGGLGIGLALVRRLVEMHGGRVIASSAGRGQGSEFTVRLPLAGSADTAREESPEPVAQPTAGLRCLVVDDNVDAADSMVALLQAAGHVAAACHDGPSALDAWTRERPQLAILDIGLPGMDGYELARRIRALPGGPSAYLAALTGYGQASDAEQAVAAGFDVHLVKPLLPDALAQLLMRARAARDAAG